MRKISLVTVFLCIALNWNSTRAGFVVSVGSQDGLGSLLEFNAGTRATVWVHALDSTPGSPLNLDTYSLAFQVGNSTTIPSTFTNFSVDFTEGLIANAPPPSFGLVTDPGVIQADPFPGHNIIVSNDRTTGPSPLVSGNPNRLFSLSFDIDPTTAGTFQFRFVPDAQQFGGPVNQAVGTGFPEDFGTRTNSGGTFFNQFTVSAVPEPSSLVLVTLVSGIVGWRFRRRQFN